MTSMARLPWIVFLIISIAIASQYKSTSSTSSLIRHYLSFIPPKFDKMITKSASGSAATKSFLDAVEGRRSIYSLSAESPIPDSRIQELVEFTIKHSPSTYNVQSARAVVLLGEHHKKLWKEITPKHMKTTMPADKWAHFEPRINGFAAAYGTVMFFEDEETLEALGQKNPMVQPMLSEWSAHSQGLHHLILWTALEAEGLGANLQHFNFHPAIAQEMKDAWDLPSSWKAHAQLVFGTPTGDPMEKSFEPLENRVKVIA